MYRPDGTSATNACPAYQCTQVFVVFVVALFQDEPVNASLAFSLSLPSQSSGSKFDRKAPLGSPEALEFVRLLLPECLYMPFLMRVKHYFKTL